MTAAVFAETLGNLQLGMDLVGKKTRAVETKLVKSASNTVANVCRA
jgi:hypothetical protein